MTKFQAIIFDMDGVLIDQEQVSMPLIGVEELLKKLRMTGIKIAIASGSYLSRIEAIVNRFNWQNYFDVLVSTDHVDFRDKPDPAVYAHTARVLGLDPDSCVAVEDSVNGLRAAKSAGMSCIAAIDERWSYGDFSEADLVVKSLSDDRIGKFIGIN